MQNKGVARGPLQPSRDPAVGATGRALALRPSLPRNVCRPEGHKFPHAEQGDACLAIFFGGRDAKMLWGDME
jgi:hypothetical protein